MGATGPGRSVTSPGYTEGTKKNAKSQGFFAFFEVFCIVFWCFIMYIWIQKNTGHGFALMFGSPGSSGIATEYQFHGTI